MILQALQEKDEAVLKTILKRNIKNGLKIIKKIYSQFFVF